MSLMKDSLPLVATRVVQTVLVGLTAALSSRLSMSNDAIVLVAVLVGVLSLAVPADAFSRLARHLYLSRSIREDDDIEALLGAPVLGRIPDISSSNLPTRYHLSYGYSYRYGDGHKRLREKRKKPPRKAAEVGRERVEIELIPFLRPRLVVSELYRSFAIELRLSSISSVRVVAVAAIEVGEGATSTAVNLAVVLKEHSKRVLLVDSDSHAPRIHSIFGLRNEAGFFDYLAGTIEAADTIMETHIPGLWTTAAGRRLDEAKYQVTLDRARLFVDWARTEFDFVVFDTLALSEARNCSEIRTVADGVVLCVRPRGVRRRTALSYLETLRREKSTLLGVILNRVRQMHSQKRYRGVEIVVEEHEDQGVEGDRWASPESA